MTDPTLENSLETLYIDGQQQTSIDIEFTNDEIAKILAGAEFTSEIMAGSISVPFDSLSNSNGRSEIDDMINPLSNYNEQLDINATIDPLSNNSEQLDIDAIIDPSSNQMASNSFQLDLSQMFDVDIEEFLQKIQKQEPKERELFPPSLQQSTFIEHNDMTTCYQSGIVTSPPSSVPVGTPAIELAAIDNLIYAQTYVNQQYQVLKTAKKSKQIRNHQQRQTTNVGPVDYIHSGGCQPCTTVEMQTDFAYQQQLLEYDAADSKQIQIRCQPRPKFRPRTENESKNSSHYLRCDEGVKPEYPTINIPQTWFFQTDVNLIEVALVGLDKEPHPYAIINKSASDTYEDNVLIFKQADPSVLYFRLTNEDFQNGFKTFMIELIKGKQDDVITKDLIRTRQLEHSMLRFTRIYQAGKGNFQRDEGSAEYSSVMSEAYGDVDIEHMGPRFGPMSGQDMVYIVLKGRILKNDLKIEITEELTGWGYSVDSFTKNGNVIYFLMPAFPYPQNFETIKANILIYYKDDVLSQSPYLYKGSLDQDLAQLHLGDPVTTTSSTSNSFNLFNYFSATDTCPKLNARRGSSPKVAKRLSYKLKK